MKTNIFKYIACSQWLVACVCCIPPAEVMAERLDAGINVALGAIHDSNRTLNPYEDQSVSGQQIRSDIEIARITEISSLESVLRYIDENLGDYEGQEADSTTLSTSGMRHFSRSDLSGSLELKSDTTLATEVQAAGNIEENKDRMVGLASARYGYRLSEIDHIFAGATFEKVDYQDTENTRLSEYEFVGENAGYSRKLSEVSNAQISIFHNELENPSVLYRNRTVGAKGLWDLLITEAISAKFGFGLRQTIYESTDIYGRDVRQESNGRVSEFQLRYAGNIIRASVSGNYDLAPNSFGELVTRQVLSAGLAISLSPLRTIYSDINYWRQRSDLEINADDNIDSLQVSLSIKEQINENTSLFARYRRFDRKIVEDSIEAGSDLFLIEAVWNYEQRSL